MATLIEESIENIENIPFSFGDICKQMGISNGMGIEHLKKSMGSHHYILLKKRSLERLNCFWNALNIQLRMLPLCWDPAPFRTSVNNLKNGRELLPTIIENKSIVDELFVRFLKVAILNNLPFSSQTNKFVTEQIKYIIKRSTIYGKFH